MGRNSHRSNSDVTHPYLLGRSAGICLLLALASGCSCVPLNDNKWGMFNDPHPVISGPGDLPAALHTHPESLVTAFDQDVAWFSTGWKRLGVSGWRVTSHTATVTGTVKQSAFSTDDFLTLDILLTELSLDGTPISLTDDRYIRAEVCTSCLNVEKADYALIGDSVKISGRIVWDSDGDGFYEIHPTGKAGYTLLKRALPP